MGQGIYTDIVLVTDTHRVESTIVLACSLFRRVSNPIHIHIVCDTLSLRQQDTLKNILNAERGEHIVSLLTVESAHVCAGLHQKFHFTQAAYLRCFFDTLFPDTDRIIYMDTDMLVVDYFDPKKLLAAVDEKSLAAVEEDVLREIYESAYPEIRFGRCLNTGFMVMNLGKIRESNMLQEIVSWLKKHIDTLCYADQDGFCAIGAHDCFWLDPRLNVINKSIKNPLIVHYAGNLYKPWLKTGSLLSTKRSISSIPYILFRQKTPIKKSWQEIVILLFFQGITSLMLAITPYTFLKKIHYICSVTGVRKHK